MKTILKKIKQFHREHGLKALFVKMRLHLGLEIKKWINQTLKKQRSIEEVLANAYPHATPITSLTINRDHLRLNLVLDHLKEDAFFGGVGTSLILASLFANQHQIPLRIISRAAENRPGQFFDFLKLQGIPKPERVEFFSDHNREITLRKPRLEISNKDIFLATSWWTAEAIRSINLRKNYFHLIQDIPSVSYGDEIHRYNQVLKDPKGLKISNIKTEGCFFEPAFPKVLHAPNHDAFQIKLKKKLLFYSRPSKPQNLFHTGLKLLDEALLRGIIQPAEWTIYFAGEKTPEIIFSTGVKPKILGKLEWGDYLEWIKTVDLGFCLFDSPHPNYVALDIASSGGVVLKNSSSAQKYSSNIIEEALDMNSMMRGFQTAIHLAKDPAQRQKNFENNSIPENWHHAFKEALHYMEVNK